MESIKDVFIEAMRAALQEYGAGVVLLILGIITLFILHERLWWRLIREKNREIARIAKERNRLQEEILKKRIGTGLSEEGEPQT